MRQGSRLGGTCLGFLPFALLILHLFLQISVLCPQKLTFMGYCFSFSLHFLGGLSQCEAGDKRVRLDIKNLFPSHFLPGALGSAVIFYQRPQVLKSDPLPCTCVLATAFCLTW